MLNNKKILITGGGQIGMELGRRLAPLNQVLIWGHPRNDIRNENYLIESCCEFSPNYIIHTAADKYLTSCEQNPDRCIDINIGGTRNLIEAAKACNAEKTVFLSSISAENPQNTYAATKFLGEKLFTRSNLTYPGRFLICRLGTVLSKNSFITHWIRQIEAGETIQVTSLSCVRPFISLNTAIEAILDTFEKKDIHVVRAEFYELSDVVSILESLLEQKIKYKIIGMRLGESEIEGDAYMKYTGPISYLEDIIKEIWNTLKSEAAS